MPFNNIRIPVNNVYQATVVPDEDGGITTADTLSWTNSNSKVAEMIVGENGKQTISLKATMNPKGAADDVTWTADSTDHINVKPSGKNNVTGKLEITNAAVGEVYTVRATSATGVSTTAKIRVLKKPTSVEIHDPEKAGNVKFSEPKATGNGTIANTKYIEIGKFFEMKPEINLGTAKEAKWVEAGTDNTERVTYTQSCAGKVNIIGNTVYGVKEGKVTITAKTPNNKKTTLKVEVKAAE